MTSQSGSFVFRILFGLVIAWFADVSNAQEVGTPAAPPRKCEVRQAAWCIDQGAWEITDRFIKHDKYDHAWTVRGFFRPKAPLVVLEPSGCRDGFSDSLSAIRFDLRYAWDGKTWNRMVVRPRHDGSCDLDVLIPKYEDDPSAEAFFSGLALLRNCLSDNCGGQAFNALASKWDADYRRGKTASPWNPPRGRTPSSYTSAWSAIDSTGRCVLRSQCRS